MDTRIEVPPPAIPPQALHVPQELQDSIRETYPKIHPRVAYHFHHEQEMVQEQLRKAKTDSLFSIMEPIIQRELDRYSDITDELKAGRISGALNNLLELHELQLDGLNADKKFDNYPQAYRDLILKCRVTPPTDLQNEPDQFFLEDFFCKDLSDERMADLLENTPRELFKVVLHFEANLARTEASLRGNPADQKALDEQKAYNIVLDDLKKPLTEGAPFTTNANQILSGEWHALSGEEWIAQMAGNTQRVNQLQIRKGAISSYQDLLGKQIFRTRRLEPIPAPA